VDATVGEIVGRWVAAMVGLVLRAAVGTGVGVLVTDTQVGVEEGEASRVTGVAVINPRAAVGSTVAGEVSGPAGTDGLHAAASNDSAASKDRDVYASLDFPFTMITFPFISLQYSPEQRDGK